jgi:DNA repair protein RadA/Sms
MAKSRTFHRCQGCGATTPKWAGRCPECQGWNTLVEEPGVPAAGPAFASGPADTPRPIGEVDRVGARPRPTGVAELDRVLGGGLVPGSVTLLGGEPGIGKSTLLLEAAGAAARGGARVLYVAAEEAAHQVRCRADRLGAVHPDLWLASETTVPHIVHHLDTVDPSVVVIDSIQAVHDPALTSAPGSVAQVREGAARFVREAKRRDVATVLVGHVTKDGALAGPRVLEHVVDTVLAFEGDRHDALRLLRAVKHRFGPTDQLGLFEMTGAGLAAVADPSRLFLADRRPGQAGSVVVPLVDGHRPLLVEVQALTASTPADWPCCSPSSTVAGVSPPTTPTCSASRSGGCAWPSRPPTWGSPWPWPRRAGTSRSPVTWWRWASWASGERCARSPTPTAAWPRPPGWGSAGRWCPGRSGRGPTT